MVFNAMAILFYRWSIPRKPLDNGSQVRAIRHMTFTFLIRVVTHLVDSFLGGLYPSAEKLGPIPQGSLGQNLCCFKRGCFHII
jgi:hypothetical protein